MDFLDDVDVDSGRLRLLHCEMHIFTLISDFDHNSVNNVDVNNVTTSSPRLRKY